MALLGVENSDEHKAVLRNLGNGECIFRDLDGRAGRIGVDLVSDELLRWLDTNPTRAKPGEVDSARTARGNGGPPRPAECSARPGDRSHPGGSAMRVPPTRRRRKVAEPDEAPRASAGRFSSSC